METPLLRIMYFARSGSKEDYLGVIDRGGNKEIEGGSDGDIKH